MMARDLKYGFQWGRFGVMMLIMACLCGFPIPIPGQGQERLGSAASISEEPAVREAVTRYLNAEVKRDLPAVYDCLAPSSVYCATHDYQAFLAEANASPVRIVGYKILRIAHIRDNEDLKGFPKVEKFAHVEVDVSVFYKDTNEKADINFGFTFIKERGKWYKG